MCANNQQLNGLTISQTYAKSKKVLCLSKEYKNTKIKLEWKCYNKNHPTWLSPFEKVVRRNQWCPECYKERKNTL